MDRFVVAFLVKDQPGFEALDEGVHKAVPLVQPDLIVEFVYFDVPNTVASVLLLNQCGAMDFVLLPKLIVLVSMEVS